MPRLHPTRTLTFRGETKPLRIWAREMGINHARVRSRLKFGWSIDRALTEPVREWKPATDQLASPTQLPLNAKDLTGQRFGRLYVLEYVGSSFPSTGRSGSLWKCRCDCGQETLSEMRLLMVGNKKSCGCLHSEVARQKRIDSARRITSQGETKTIAEWAEATDLTVATIRTRLKAGWSIDRALTEPPIEVEGRLLLFRGETKTLYEWAAELGFDHHCVRQRLEIGWSVDRALTEPLAPRRPSITFQGQTKTIGQWAKELGFDYQALRYRFESGWSVERALTEPKRRTHA